MHIKCSVVPINRKGVAKNVSDKKNRSGVTLIELLIVVLILAALSAIAIPRISQSAAKANARSCTTNIAILNSTIERYYVRNGIFPAKLKDVSEDTAYFPDGPPHCPIDNQEYPRDLTANNRVDASGHTH